MDSDPSRDSGCVLGAERSHLQPDGSVCSRQQTVGRAAGLLPAQPPPSWSSISDDPLVPRSKQVQPVGLKVTETQCGCSPSLFQTNLIAQYFKLHRLSYLFLLFMLLRNSLNLPTEQKHVTDVFDIKDFYCRDRMKVFFTLQGSKWKFSVLQCNSDIFSTSVTVV